MWVAEVLHRFYRSPSAPPPPHLPLTVCVGLSFIFNYLIYIPHPVTAWIAVGYTVLVTPLGPIGKSSIFQAVLNHMTLESGGLHVGGTMAYVPQTPWVQNLTLKDNIIFGLPFNEEKYKQVGLLRVE